MSTDHTSPAIGLRRITRLPTEFWLVWNPQGHAPTYPHTSEQSAITEAERLARTNPGQQFFVLQPTHARFVDAMHRVTFNAAPQPETDGGFFAATEPRESHPTDGRF